MQNVHDTRCLSIRLKETSSGVYLISTPETDIKNAELVSHGKEKNRFK